MRTIALFLLSLTILLAPIQPEPTGPAAPDVPEPPGPVYLPIVFRGVDANATANQYVRPYNEPFQYGLNPGYYGSNWNDQAVFGLCYDAGCRSIRGSLPDEFIGQWGPTIRVKEYSYAVQTLQFRELTVFLGQPRPEWRDPTQYGGQQSKLWQGLYAPIWDNGENGTPVNDSNRFALYIWTIVQHYGPYIRFYEIINEPDYTNSNLGWAARGQPGNWWENPPQPTDLPNLNAPVYQYIRLLRIAYAVVHRYDPDAYVTPGGIGYDSFLDALLRYTDNPDQGKVTPDYPLTGAAYFDALSFHLYPMYGTRAWDGRQWVPQRHSDRAVQVLAADQQGHAALLEQYGYDGARYPRKPMILTEINVARQEIGGYLGGAELQRNFTIKAIVKAQELGIGQLYWYSTGEGRPEGSATSPYDVMGFYYHLNTVTPGSQRLTDQGIANRTAFQQLYGWTYDAAATQALNLPATVDGAAFRQGSHLRYVLWARTTTDRSETAAAVIQLPGSYLQTAWNGQTQTVSGTNLQLTGAPVFLTPQ